MTIIGSASVQIRALDKFFEADVKKAVEKIKDVTIKVTAEFDDNGVSDKVKALREEQTVKLTAELDDNGVTGKIKKLREEASAQNLTIRAEADTKAADEDLTNLKRSHDNAQVTVQATAETTAATTQMRWLSRDRSVLIHPIIDPGSFVTAKAILESLSGFNTLRTLKDALKDAAVGFDTASLKAMTLTSGILSLVSSLGWLAAEAFAAGEGISELIGFAAMAPTMLGAVGTSIVAMHLSWNNFADAMSEDPKKAAKALALLPPAAQKAATETKKLWDQIKKPVQPAFWDSMGDSLQTTLAAMAPALTKGLEGTAKHLGTFTKNFLESFKKIAENKTLDAMFDNLNATIDNLGKGITPFVDALNTLGFVGSKYLPQMGQWLADLAVRFNNFITKAAANGDIERWIEEAKNSMERLWKIGDATIGVFQGLTTAFNAAGAGGLGELVTDMQRMEEIVKGPVFQSQFADIFGGMLIGAEQANEGFTNLFKTIGGASQVFGQVFAMAGGVVKELADGLATLAGTDDFQVGILKSLSGLKKGLNDLQPSFENMGTVFGGLLEIAGAIASNIAPVLNTATKLIADVIDSLKDGFIDVIPVLMNFVDNINIAFGGPIRLIADVIGNLLSAFSDLPGPVSTALMALGAVLLLAPKINDAFKGMREGIKKAADGANDAKPGYVWLKDVKDWAGEASARMGRSFADLKVGMTDSVNWGKAAAADLKAAGSMAGSDFVGGVRGGIGALGFLGSEIGTAFSKSFGQLSSFISSTATSVANAVTGVVDRATTALKRATGPLVFVAEQAWSDIKTSMVNTLKDAFGGVGDGFSNLKTTFSNFAENAKYYAKLGAQNLTTTLSEATERVKGVFTTMVDDTKNQLSSMATYARQRMTDTGTAIRDGFNNMVASTQPFRNAVSDLARDVYDRTIYMETRFRDMGAAIGTAGQTIGSGFRAVAEQASQAGSYLMAATEPVTRTISNAATAAVDGVNRGVEAVRNTGAAMAANLANNFAPVGAAFGAVEASVREGLSNIRTHVGNMGDAFGGIVRSTGPAITAIGNVTKAIGSAAGGGLAYAARGLTDALGGPWGIAIAAATTAIALFGQAQADAARNVDTLAGSLDKQTGATTKATEDNVAKLLTQKEGWFGLGESTLDYAKKLGLSTDMFTKAVAGDQGSREEYLKFHDGWGEAVKKGGAAMDEFREKNGLTDMSLLETQRTMNAVHDAYEKYKAQLSDAQKKVLDVAEATGTNTVQASILAANYDVLNSKTSSASEKFAALKANLDVLNGGQLSAAESSKNYYQTLDTQRAAIDSIKQANNGLVTNLFSVGTGFDMTKQAGRDLHTTLSTQRDAILQLGTAAMDEALKRGEDATAARKAATDAMGPAIGTLQADLAKLGFAPDVIKAITDSLGLVPDKITTALGIEGAEETRRQIALTQMAAQAYATGNYTAALAALPDDAKAAITETFNLGDAFAKGDYEAVLKALDQTGAGRDAAVAGIIASVGGDKEAFKAHLKALDETGPGVRSAMTTIGGVQGKTVSILAEDKTSGTISYIQRQIDGITRYVKVTVDTVYNNYAGKAGNLINPDAANGALLRTVTNASSLASGMMPMRTYANGGIEQHFAQIAPAGAMRLWAEPETGGEAYIPLALNKRKRSKKILEEVARIFGFGLFQMFAEGGLNQPSAAPSYTPSSSQQYAPSGPLVAVYPSAALDEEKVGEIAARRVFHELRNR